MKERQARKWNFRDVFETSDNGLPSRKKLTANLAALCVTLISHSGRVPPEMNKFRVSKRTNGAISKSCNSGSVN